MCNLSKGVKDEGIEIGLVRGRAEGDEKRTIISIENLMETLKLSMQQAMDALKIPDADQAYYANTIKGK
jgi:predicted transposase YdaD